MMQAADLPQGQADQNMQEEQPLQYEDRLNEINAHLNYHVELFLGSLQDVYQSEQAQQ